MVGTKFYVTTNTTKDEMFELFAIFVAKEHRFEPIDDSLLRGQAIDSIVPEEVDEVDDRVRAVDDACMRTIAISIIPLDF